MCTPCRVYKREKLQWFHRRKRLMTGINCSRLKYIPYMWRIFCYKPIFITVSYEFPRWPGSGSPWGSPYALQLVSHGSDQHSDLWQMPRKPELETKTLMHQRGGKEAPLWQILKVKVVLSNVIAMTILLERHFWPKQQTQFSYFCKFLFIARLNTDTRMLFLHYITALSVVAAKHFGLKMWLQICVK